MFVSRTKLAVLISSVISDLKRVQFINDINENQPKRFFVFKSFVKAWSDFFEDVNLDTVTKNEEMLFFFFFEVFLADGFLSGFDGFNFAFG